jgi:hypothetical protein
MPLSPFSCSLRRRVKNARASASFWARSSSVSTPRSRGAHRRALHQDRARGLDELVEVAARDQVQRALAHQVLLALVVDVADVVALRQRVGDRLEVLLGLVGGADEDAEHADAADLLRHRFEVADRGLRVGEQVGDRQADRDVTPEDRARDAEADGEDEAGPPEAEALREDRLERRERRHARWLTRRVQRDRRKRGWVMEPTQGGHYSFSVAPTLKYSRRSRFSRKSTSW